VICRFTEEDPITRAAKAAIDKNQAIVLFMVFSFFLFVFEPRGRLT
jgi:hypothetical protein